MKLLIIGGTRFLGRHVAQQALQAGHQVTLVHRGQSGPELFPAAEHRLGDRDGDLTALLPAGRDWDAVIDTSAYVPRHVRSMAHALSGRVGVYQLVSTISVYREFSRPGLSEEGAALATLEDPNTEVVDGQTYGGLKALCETTLQALMPGRADIVRPGLLVGPHDPTGRFSWWVQRLRAGGEVLCPGQPDAPVQFIDARDAAAWMLARAERGDTGVAHVSGPMEPLTMGDLLEAARAALNPSARLRWVDTEFLLREGVTPWTELPLWVPPEAANLHTIDLSRARASGLKCRPVAQTLRDTAQWLEEQHPPWPAAIGLAPQRELQLLSAWQLVTRT